MKLWKRVIDTANEYVALGTALSHSEGRAVKLAICEQTHLRRPSSADLEYLVYVLNRRTS
jgi:hypothetical protein